MAKAIGPTKEPLVKGVDTTFRTKAALKKPLQIAQKIEKDRAWGYPLGGNKLELAAKMAQDASKSGFQEALEVSWGRLGRPKRELSWSNSEAWRQVF